MHRFTIIIPTFKQSSVIGETLDCLINQNFRNFDVIISIDGEDYSYVEVSKKYNDKRFIWLFNKNNLGFCGNINRALDHAKGEIIFFLGSDDLIPNNTLSYYDEAFKKNKSIKVIARTYYAFDLDKNKPVRVKDRFDNDFKIIKINSNFNEIKTVLSTLDQFSNLAFYRNEMMIRPSADVFTSHAYTVVDIFLRTSNIGFISKDLLAVRLSHSQCRTISSIYDKSPMISWIEFLRFFFIEKSDNPLLYQFLKNNWITKNYVGLFQIANFSKKKYFYSLREIFFLLKYNFLNFFNPILWIVSFMCIVIPKYFLIKVVDFVKLKLNKSFITDRNIS